MLNIGDRKLHKNLRCRYETIWRGKSDEVAEIYYENDNGEAGEIAFTISGKGAKGVALFIVRNQGIKKETK
jgi:hypothetical protein